MVAVSQEEIRKFWNENPCNLRHSPALFGSKQYFDEVEARKYFVEPHIPLFAEFKHWAGKKVLEVGCGIGTDTINFARNGAVITATDISDFAISTTQTRANLYGMQNRVRLLRCPVEELQSKLQGEKFDLIYAFGSIHHTANPRRSLSMLREFSDNSTILKIMVYSKYSMKTLQLLWKTKSWRKVLHSTEANMGCPAVALYAKKELQDLLSSTGWEIIEAKKCHIFPYIVKYYKTYEYKTHIGFAILPRWMFRVLETLLGFHWLVTARRTRCS